MLAFVLSIALAATDLGDPYPCNVARRCSATGVECSDSDRACKEDARARGLEINCDAKSDAGASYVYCPPMTGRGSDSFAQWILLGVAGFIAIGGGIVAWYALRRRR